MVKSGNAVDFESALSLILKKTSVAATKTISIVASHSRIPAGNIQASRPDPGYDQSIRDGFALGRSDLPIINGMVIYRLSGEVPAGSLDDVELEPDSACRIMTGALLPKGCVAVVPQELCTVEDTELLVPHGIFDNPERYIQRKGSRVAPGTIIAKGGERLTSGAIAMLAITGVSEVAVYQKPKVAFFCSGNELIHIDNICKPGQKVSSNRYLLYCLINANGAEADDYSIVEDDRQHLDEVFSKIIKSDNDIVISTGGLGPGKYDLIEAAFVNAGGQLLYRSLTVRPGKATLFGVLGDKLYFGLPGPPAAVKALFNECIKPSLRKMQGMKSYKNSDLRAHLSHDVTLNSCNVMSLREGVLCCTDSGRTVRLARYLEVGDCFVIFPEGTLSYQKGDMVTIHTTAGMTLS